MIYISIIKGVLKMTRQKYIGEYLAKDGETTFRLFKHGSELLANIELVTGKSPELQQKIIKEILDPYKFDYYIPVHNTGTMYVTDNELF